MFLKFIFRNFNIFKAYVIIYCRKLEFKGYKMQKELELRIEVGRRALRHAEHAVRRVGTRGYPGIPFLF